MNTTRTAPTMASKKSELDHICDDAESAKARGQWKLYAQLADCAGAILSGLAEPAVRS